MVIGSPVLITSCRPKIHGTNLKTYSIDRCENKQPIQYAHRFHRDDDTEVEETGDKESAAEKSGEQ
ncbi:hypothetical protein HAX54_040575, partial [Datura stramonium]|nr:hypothetical protein [Datura stramonium]